VALTKQWGRQQPSSQKAAVWRPTLSLSSLKTLTTLTQLIHFVRNFSFFTGRQFFVVAVVAA